jgi:lipoyl(octanoyl) transferase
MASDCRRSVDHHTTTEFHLLGSVAFDSCLALQERLAYEAGSLNEGRIVVLLCEHPDLITVGRLGSRGHIRLTDKQLRRERLDVRWISRGGGCVLHAPGQLAVYPIVPLETLGWTVGQYLRRLQRGIVEALGELKVHCKTIPGRFGVWGRSGQLACVGVAVRRWITLHGAFINVNPAMRRYAFVDTLPHDVAGAGEKTTMGCLLAERRAAVRMANVRSALVKTLAAAFDCERYHLHTGHPWLTPSTRTPCESSISNG